MALALCAAVAGVLASNGTDVPGGNTSGAPVDGGADEEVVVVSSSGSGGRDDRPDRPTHPGLPPDVGFVDPPVIFVDPYFRTTVTSQ